MSLVLFRIDIMRVSQGWTTNFWVRNLFFLELSELFLELGRCRAHLSMGRRARLVAMSMINIIRVNRFLLLWGALNLVVVRFIKILACLGSFEQSNLLPLLPFTHHWNFFLRLFILFVVSRLGCCMANLFLFLFQWPSIFYLFSRIRSQAYVV